MRRQPITIPPNQAFELSADGDYVRVKRSAVDLVIENPDNGQNIEVSQGDDFEFDHFRRLRISHASGVDQTVLLLVSKGKKAGSSQVSGNVAGTVAVSNLAETHGAGVQAQDSVTNVNKVIIAANVNRRYLLIQNNDAAQVLRVKADGNVASATVGFRIQPGGTFEVPNYCVTGAINACMEGATAAANNVEFLTA